MKGLEKCHISEGSREEEEEGRTYDEFSEKNTESYDAGSEYMYVLLIQVMMAADP